MCSTQVFVRRDVTEQWKPARFRYRTHSSESPNVPCYVVECLKKSKHRGSAVFRVEGVENFRNPMPPSRRPTEHELTGNGWRQTRRDLGLVMNNTILWTWHHGEWQLGRLSKRQNANFVIELIPEDRGQTTVSKRASEVAIPTEIKENVIRELQPMLMATGTDADVNIPGSAVPKFLRVPKNSTVFAKCSKTLRWEEAQYVHYNNDGSHYVQFSVTGKRGRSQKNGIRLTPTTRREFLEAFSDSPTNADAPTPMPVDRVHQSVQYPAAAVPNEEMMVDSEDDLSGLPPMPMPNMTRRRRTIPEQPEQYLNDTASQASDCYGYYSHQEQSDVQSICSSQSACTQAPPGMGFDQSMAPPAIQIPQTPSYYVQNAPTPTGSQQMAYQAAPATMQPVIFFPNAAQVPMQQQYSTPQAVGNSPYAYQYDSSASAPGTPRSTCSSPAQTPQMPPQTPQPPTIMSMQPMMFTPQAQPSPQPQAVQMPQPTSDIWINNNGVWSLARILVGTPTQPPQQRAPTAFYTLNNTQTMGSASSDTFSDHSSVRGMSDFK